MTSRVGTGGMLSQLQAHGEASGKSFFQCNLVPPMSRKSESARGSLQHSGPSVHLCVHKRWLNIQPILNRLWQWKGKRFVWTTQSLYETFIMLGLILGVLFTSQAYELRMWLLAALGCLATGVEGGSLPLAWWRIPEDSNWLRVGSGDHPKARAVTTP